MLDFEEDGGSGEDVTGPAFEIGVAYAFETQPMSVTAGYKHQVWEADGDDEWEQTLSGLTLGVNYTF